MKKKKFSLGWVIFWAIVCHPIGLIYLAYKLSKNNL